MSAATENPLTDSVGLYIHFPWCIKKCPYCDFNSHPLRGDLPEADYLRALLADLNQQVDSPTTFDTVFFGGGTPSLFPPEVFGSLLRHVDLIDDAEVTMEANPGTAEHHDWRACLDAGINRLSFGAQSFDSSQLNLLGRIHNPQETVDCLVAARKAGFANINLDLMYGLPGQIASGALADLQAAIALSPDHISWYQLTIEPRTEFAGRPPTLPAGEVIEAMESSGIALLESAGFARYEVSAFARPGRRCRHNLTYWRFGDYVGVGAGAHGKRTDGAIQRTHKPRQPRLYLQDPLSTYIDQVAPEDIAVQFLMNALRLVDGVPFERFEEATGLSVQTLSDTWQRTVELGLTRPDRLATTPFGYRHLDSVLQYFLR